MKLENRFKILVIVLTLLLVASLFANIVMAAASGTPEPGSQEDPLVSKSYVDEIIKKYETQLEELKKKYEAIAKQLDSLGGKQPSGGGAQAFELVSLEAGKALYTGSGTELVLRSGVATAIMGENGGLSDVTSAKDLANKASVAANHLLISARDDGRGISATSQCWILVRGSYRIGVPPAGATGGNTSSTGTGSSSNTGSNTGGTQEQGIQSIGIVNASALNVRGGPSTDAALITQIYRGDKVIILSQQGDWYRVRTSSGITGWVLATYITKQ